MKRNFLHWRHLAFGKGRQSGLKSTVWVQTRLFTTFQDFETSRWGIYSMFETSRPQYLWLQEHLLHLTSLALLILYTVHCSTRCQVYLMLKSIFIFQTLTPKLYSFNPTKYPFLPLIFWSSYDRRNGDFLKLLFLL